METLIELAIPLGILGFFACKCIRLKPKFGFVSPFNPQAKMFYDKEKKGRLGILLGILVFLMVAPFFVLMTMSFVTGEKIEFVNPEKEIRENHLSMLSDWLPEELHSDIGGINHIEHDLGRGKGLANFKSQSGGKNVHYTLYYKTDRDLLTLEAYRLVRIEDYYSTTIWEGSISHESPEEMTDPARAGNG